MKSILKVAVAIAAVITLQTASAQKGEWKELQAFHSVMSKTFHPSEEGNLKPVKDSASVLLASAKAWAASTVPENFKPEETKKVLTALVAKCGELNQAVASNLSDAELKKIIAEAHEVFHQLVEKCRKPE
jgi:hypothetical protein